MNILSNALTQKSSTTPNPPFHLHSRKIYPPQYSLNLGVEQGGGRSPVSSNRWTFFKEAPLSLLPFTRRNTRRRCVAPFRHTDTDPPTHRTVGSRATDRTHRRVDMSPSSDKKTGAPLPEFPWGANLVSFNQPAAAADAGRADVHAACCSTAGSPRCALILFGSTKNCRKVKTMGSADINGGSTREAFQAFRPGQMDINGSVYHSLLIGPGLSGAHKNHLSLGF